MTLPFRRVFPCAMVLLAASCSSPAPTTAPVDAGTDIVDTAPEDAFIGTGNLVFAWTVRGMAPDVGCAAAGGATVHFSADGLLLHQDVMVPCTDGHYDIMNANVTTGSVRAELLDASGALVHSFDVDTSVMANQTTTANIRFEAPGSLRLQWTVNGAPPSETCAMVGGVSVVAEVQGVPGTGRSCVLGSITVPNVQVGPRRVTGILQSRNQRLQQLMGVGDVPSGGTVTVDLAFEAPVLPDH